MAGAGYPAGINPGAPLKKLVLLVLSLSSLPLVTHQAHAVDVTPMVSLGRPTGNWADRYDAGLGLALAIGGRLHPNLSLDGLLASESMTPDAGPDSIHDLSA